MPVQVLKERFNGKINTVTIGATAANGGTRTSVVTVGGETCLPFMAFEGVTPNKPVIAMEVYDIVPDWCDELKNAIGDAINNPVEWAKKCVNEFGADMLFVRLMSADPDLGDSSPAKCVETVKAILAAVGVPLAITSCGINEIDNAVIAAVAEGCAGENLLLGIATQDNYNTITAACMVHKHCLIAGSPLDINICKQTNILISEMNMDMNKVIIDPSIGGLGYGIEYSYSILERGRTGALQGDKMLAMPSIATIGFEAWKAKEANANESEFPGWGDQAERGILWEAVTAAAHLHSGVDILIMRHPKAVELVKHNAEELMAGNAF